MYNTTTTRLLSPPRCRLKTLAIITATAAAWPAPPRSAGRPTPDARRRTPDAHALFSHSLSELPVEFASSQERQFHVIRTAPLDTKEIPHNYDVLRHCLKSTKEEVHEAEMRLHRQPVSNDEVRALALTTSKSASLRPPRNRHRPPDPTHTHTRSRTRSPPPRRRWSGSARWRCSGRRRSST